MNAPDTAAPAATPAQVAKGALRRLAMAKLEPTPENYARAFAEEAGLPPPVAQDAKSQGPIWATLIEKVARGLERSGRQWTAGRRRESLHRVLDGSRGDAARLQQRLQALLASWEGDRAFEGETPAPAETAPMPLDGGTDWRPMVGTFEGTLRAALPESDANANELADRLGRLADRIAAEGVSDVRLAELDDLCERARRFFGQRHRLIDELGALARELGRGLTELSEDESWARGQCETLEARLAEGLSVRSVRAAGALLAETRTRQRRVRQERNAARDALKNLFQRMLAEIGELGEHTGRYQESMGRHAAAIERADSIESLAGVVREMLEENHAVQQVVGRTQERLQAEHAKAAGLEARVRALEGELRRLSDEVSTDALTQVANRRGLAAAFEAESARAQRAAEGAPGLAVALIDIDNFKKLNDTLGHAAGDVALKSLAAAVRERLRPVDHLARFGGEEFVVLLPATPVDEAQQALTRLQRSLTEALFLHEEREVFVTFSAGVTGWRPGEALEAALERADEALYEAKRSGKNRTCKA